MLLYEDVFCKHGSVRVAAIELCSVVIIGELPQERVGSPTIEACRRHPMKSAQRCGRAAGWGTTGGQLGDKRGTSRVSQSEREEFRDALK